MAAPLGFVRRLFALQRVAGPAFARAVTLALLRRVAAQTAPDLKIPRYRCAYPKRAQGALDGLATFLISQPLEESAYFLSCVYAVLCEPNDRRDLAMYFTPPALARHILASVGETTSTLANLRFMDPACGGAAFLLPVVITLRDRLRASGSSARDIVCAVNRQVLGVEKSPVLAELSRQFIRLALSEELLHCRLEIGPIVQVGDSLDLFIREKLPRVNVLLCNPPYRKIRASELAWYRGRFASVITGQPNLYTMFMRLALDVVIPGGVVALLTPTSYFSGPTYKRIRDLYVQRSSILRIDLIHERDNLFLGVEHDVAALLARPRVTRPPRQAPEVFGWDETNGWTSLGPIVLPQNDSPWHLPRDPLTSKALLRARTSRWSLADYGYRARIGGYVWNRDKRRPAKARPRGPQRDQAVPVIWATQIGQDGRFRFLSRSPKEKRARYILLRSNDRRGVVDRDCVVLQRTSSRAQRRRLVAAALPRGFAKKYGGFVGENHVIILEPINARPLVKRSALARLLNSEFMRDLYSTTTGTTAVTTTGLSELPLPDPHYVARLYDPRSMEQAVRKAFGLKHGDQRKGQMNEKAATT
jgi:adenine-specific DNA-methyltransferase